MQRRTAAASRTTSRPSTQARPPSGCSRVVRMRTAVVLPAPFGPSTPSTVPRGTDRSIPRSARTSPNDLTRPSTRIAGPELVCDTPSLPDRHPFTEPTGGHRQRRVNNRPPDTTATAHQIRRPGRAEVIADPPPAARPRTIRTSRYIASSRQTRYVANPDVSGPDGRSGDRADLPHERRAEHGDAGDGQEQGRIPAELADQRRRDRGRQHLRPG